MPKHKRNKIKRYLRVFWRNIKKLNGARIRKWLKKNLKQHPFILAFTSLVWIDFIFIENAPKELGPAKTLKFHLYLFIFWLFLVTVSNMLRDRQKVKWYLKRRFVFSMLLIFQPLGLILLWSGAKFKKFTRVFFTAFFGFIFVLLVVNYNKAYNEIIKKTALERIIESITKPKQGIFIQRAGKEALANLKLCRFPGLPNIKLEISEIASRCSSAVVSITAWDKSGKEIGAGSGFIISDDGFVVTSFHVLESAHRATVEIKEGEYREAYFIKGVPGLDIAVIKIDAQNLPFLPIGDSECLVKGQSVVVLGNPAGFERSISAGIVSAIRSKDNMKIIQMTAPVSLGSSGGPVINEYGEVIGITTLASFKAQNLNFAIPINYLIEIINGKY
jgi:hypothetical protein